MPKKKLYSRVSKDAFEKARAVWIERPTHGSSGAGRGQPRPATLPYWKLDSGIHALCNAHLLRELVYVKEITGQKWPQAMTEFLLCANQLAAAARQAEVRFSATDVTAFRTLYDAIVSEGEQLNPEADNPTGKRGRAKQSVAYNLLRRFRLHADAVLLFISDHAVPFTNNVAHAASVVLHSVCYLTGYWRG